MTREFPTIDNNDNELINELYFERGSHSKKEIYDDFIEVVEKYNQTQSGIVIIDSAKLMLYEICRSAIASNKTTLGNPNDYK